MTTHTEILSDLRNAFETGKTLPLSFRRTQLESLLCLLEESREEILDALYQDLGKPAFEGSFCEIAVITAEIRRTLDHLEEWTEDEQLPTNLLNLVDSAYIHKDPLGAIAAGNCVILKPSEVSNVSSAAIARLLPRYLDNSCYKVYEGDVDATIELLREKFDHIFFTGSAVTGRSVMAAAAKHLTPVTLELGGKCPVYVDDSADMDLAAKRILWGKLMNLGQTCVAPDYIIISRGKQQEFLHATRRYSTEWTGDRDKRKGLARIVNERHFERVKTLLGSTNGKTIFGGEADEKNLWISPAVVVDIDPDTDPLMQHEIFGPVLPVLNIDTAEAALEFINSRPKPLALYLFTKDTNAVDKFVKEAFGGGVCINDVIWHLCRDGLPFGGVGESGMGAYHGKHGVNTFCHNKAVLHRGTNYISEKLVEFRYPPYTDSHIKFMATALRIMPLFELEFSSTSMYVAMVLVGVILGYLFSVIF